jgi:uncharacterized protein YjbI with pentapeptide repeats
MNARILEAILALFCLSVISCHKIDSKDQLLLSTQYSVEASNDKNNTSSDMFLFSRKSMGCVNAQGDKGRNLEGSFECADFKDEDWSKKDLRNISFRNSKLEDINFYQANLSGADFSAADLTSSSFFKVAFTGAIFDEFTRLPEGFSREAIIKLGGFFKDYKKLDAEYTEAILQGKLTEASALSNQLAILDQSFFKKSKAIMQGPFKETIRYLNSIGVDFSSKDSNGITFFKYFFSINSSEISKYLEQKEELIYQIEKANIGGLSLDEIWDKSISLFDLETSRYGKGQLDIMDIFLKVKGVEINRRINDHSIAGKLNFSKAGLNFIIARGFDIKKDFSSRDWIDIYNTSLMSDPEKVQYLKNFESTGWDFRKIVDGRSELLDYFAKKVDRRSLEIDLSYIKYFGLNSPDFLRQVPKSLDDMIDHVIRILSHSPHSYDTSDFEEAKYYIDFFNLKDVMASLNKNLFFMLPLTIQGQYRPEINYAIFYHVKRLAAIGFPLNQGQDSFLIKVLETFDKYFLDGSVDPIYEVLEIYRKTNTFINPVYKNESVLFYQKTSMFEFFSDQLDFTVKDQLGRSLYWRLPYLPYRDRKTAFDFLQSKKVSLDLTETIEGKTLFEELFRQLNGSAE